MRILLRAATAAVLVVCAGGAYAQLVDCHGGQRPTQVAQLMFGRKIGDRIAVSEAAWVRFLDREIIVRFPAGLTVVNGVGQWQDKSTKKIVREPSRIVEIVLPGEVDDIDRLNAIAEAYKTRFKQQSVGMIVRPACVSF